MMSQKKVSIYLLMTMFSSVVLMTSCSQDALNDALIDEVIDDSEDEIGEDTGCLITTGDNYVVFEAEATNSPLGEWNLIKKGDGGYLDKEAIGPINETHLEFTGNNIGSGPAISPLEYTFKAPTTGVYRVFMRLYQRLADGVEADKSNDVFIKLHGDFTSATDQYTTEELEENMKFFGRGVNEWGSIHNGESENTNNKSAVLYNLKAGESYTFTMSGRSKNANIDYIIFYDTSITINGGAHKDIAELNDAQYLPNWDCSL